MSDTVPRWFLLQTGGSTTTVTRHHCHHYPNISLEHLILSLKSNLALCTLLTYFILDPKYLCKARGWDGQALQIVDGVG
jgi:hypothetical protein